MLRSKIFFNEWLPLGDFEILPIAREIRIKTPFFGLSWMKPEGFQVRDEKGKYRIVRVRDRTRILTLGFTILLSLTAWLVSNAARRSR